MKTKFIILGLLVAFAVPAFAQRDTIRSNKNEFSIGYGHFPASSFRYRPGYMIYPETDNIGAFYATYTRRLTKVIGVGVTACFDPIILNYHDRVNGERTLVCKVNQNSIAILPHLKINWLNTKYVNLYSKVAPIGIPEKHLYFRNNEMALPYIDLKEDTQTMEVNGVTYENVHVNSYTSPTGEYFHLWYYSEEVGLIAVKDQNHSLTLIP